MAIPVKLQVFEGPLDLLLHLIERDKIDIYDIPIVTITEQYMNYIKQMETQDMNVMSEFLLMAATLLDIKCRMLLPKEVMEDGEEEDPRTELVQKLLEYKMYKYMSFELQEKSVGAAKILYKEMSLPKEVEEFREPIDYEQLVGDMNLNKLHTIFKDVMKRQVNKIDPIRSQFGKIEKDEITMDEKMTYIQNYMKSNGRFSFKNLLEKQNSKLEVIVVFLVVLEMIKIGQVDIIQEKLFDDIEIVAKEDCEIDLEKINFVE